MKRSHLVLVALLLTVTAVSTSRIADAGPLDLPEGFTHLEIGDVAPDFELPGVDGNLADENSS